MARISNVLGNTLSAVWAYAHQNQAERHERFMGGIALIMLALGCWALTHETDPGIYIFKFLPLLYLLVGSWLITAVLYRLLLVLGINSRFLGWTALSFFAVLAIATIPGVTRIIPYQRPFIYEWLVMVGFFGSLVLDIVATTVEKKDPGPIKVQS